MERGVERIAEVRARGHDVVDALARGGEIIAPLVPTHGPVLLHAGPGVAADDEPLQPGDVLRAARGDAASASTSRRSPRPGVGRALGSPAISTIHEATGGDPTQARAGRPTWRSAATRSCSSRCARARRDLGRYRRSTASRARSMFSADEMRLPAAVAPRDRRGAAARPAGRRGARPGGPATRPGCSCSRRELEHRVRDARGPSAGSTTYPAAATAAGSRRRSPPSRPARCVGSTARRARRGRARARALATRAPGSSCTARRSSATGTRASP